jgi:hypothetical protein
VPVGCYKVPGDSTVLDPEKALAIPMQSKFLKGDNPAMFVNGFSMAIDDLNQAIEHIFSGFLVRRADRISSQLRVILPRAMVV